MNVVVEYEKPEYILELGDIVVFNNQIENIYIVTKAKAWDKEEYVLRSLTSYYYANGIYNNLESLTKSLKIENCTIYPKKDFELVLRAKKKF